MTLIAAFRSIGTPCVVGDLLVTSGSTTATRKKVVIVWPKLAIAWTGHLIAAAQILQLLRNGSPIDNFDVLRQKLTGQTAADFGSLNVTLLGWLVEDAQETCFRWRSDYPHELFLGDPMTDGSGGDFAAASLSETGLVHRPAKSGEDPPDPVSAALGVVAEFMRHELHGPTNIPLGFGFAYELAILNAKREFEYVDSIMYLGVRHELTKEGDYLGSSFAGPLIRTAQVAGQTLIYRLDPERRAEERHLITAPGSENRQLIASVATEMTAPSHRFPLAADYYCQLVYLQCDDLPCPRIVQIDRKGSSQFVTIENETSTLVLKTDRKMIEWLYKTILYDSQSDA